VDNLNVGTKETVSVNLEDRLDTITDLSSYAVSYRVANDDGTDKVPWATVAGVTLMRVDVLLDTTGWDTAHYELYVRPTIGSEMPILGPFDFNVI
jgi:hypothetical protein